MLSRILIWLPNDIYPFFPCHCYSRNSLWENVDPSFENRPVLSSSDNGRKGCLNTSIESAIWRTRDTLCHKGPHSCDTLAWHFPLQRLWNVECTKFIRRERTIPERVQLSWSVCRGSYYFTSCGHCSSGNLLLSKGSAYFAFLNFFFAPF